MGDDYDYLRESLKDTGLTDDEIEAVIQTKSVCSHYLIRLRVVSNLEGEKKKTGYEGPLKLLLRDIMGNKKKPFETVCAALDGHDRVERFRRSIADFFLHYSRQKRVFHARRFTWKYARAT